MDFAALQQEAIYPYDTSKYDFQSLIAKILSCEDRDMRLLHTTVEGADHAAVLTLAHDQCLVFHRMYYDSPLTAKVLELYDDFVKNVIAPTFKDDVVVYQKRPTFRVHLPNNTAVPSDVGGDVSRPGLHYDAQFNHPEGEINFWVPFTTTTAGNTVWTESVRDKGDFRPMLLGNGEVLRFYGNQVWHYNTLNDGADAVTRVSFDFRVIPLSEYRVDAAAVKESVQSHRKFTVGDGVMDYYTTYDKRTGGKYTFPAEGVETCVDVEVENGKLFRPERASSVVDAESAPASAYASEAEADE